MSVFFRHKFGNVIYFTSELFDSLNIPHFFASSRGGVSKGDFSSLNISSSRKDRNGLCDKEENIYANLNLGLSIINKNFSTCALMKQIHSDIVLKAQYSAENSLEMNICDAIYTDNISKIDCVCAKTADCVPILLYELKNDVACAIHAGWRGTVSDICGNAVRKIAEEYGGNCEFVAAIGPHARECCYEVDDTVFLAAKQNFKKRGIDKSQLENCFSKSYVKNSQNKYFANLKEINKIYLLRAGVSEKNISVCDLCTCCASDENGALFFSHRTLNGYSGTQMNVVAARTKMKIK